MTSEMNTTNSLQKPKYSPDIDGLRAVAVIAVILFHLFPEQFKGGFIGVDIFFVISGYLISLILWTNLEANRFSLRDFYARRIRRLAPALALVLTTCLAFGWFLLLAEEYKHLGKHSFFSTFFATNIACLRSGLFDRAADKTVTSLVG